MKMRVHFLLLLLLFTGIFCAQGQEYLSPIKASQLKSTKQIFLNEERSLNPKFDGERKGVDLCDDVKVIHSEEDEIYLQTKNNCDGYKVEYNSKELRDIILPNYDRNGNLSSWKAEFNIHSSVNGQKYVFAANTQREESEMEFCFERRKSKFYTQFSYGGKVFFTKHLPSTDGHLTVTITVKEGSSVKIKVGKTGDDLECLDGTREVYPIVGGTKFKYVAIGDGPKTKTTFGNFKFFSEQIKEKNQQVYSQENSEQESSYKNNCVFLSIANDTYRIKPLDGAPTEDAKQLIEFYNDNGFVIVPIENFRTQKDLLNKIKPYEEKIKNADVLIVHYGGHGAILDENEKEHYLLPTDYKGNEFDLRQEYPKTTLVMEKLQSLLSQGSNKYKFMHFTADACQDIVPTKDRTQVAKLTDWSVRLVNNSKVYSILRQSTFAQETTPNLDGYTDALIDHLRENEQKYASIQDMSIDEIFFVPGKQGSKANDKYFGPNGEITGDNPKTFIKNFKLNMSFDEYIKKNN